MIRPPLLIRQPLIRQLQIRPLCQPKLLSVNRHFTATSTAAAAQTPPAVSAVEGEKPYYITTPIFYVNAGE